MYFSYTRYYISKVETWRKSCDIGVSSVISYHDNQMVLLRGKSTKTGAAIISVTVQLIKSKVDKVFSIWEIIHLRLVTLNYIANGQVESKIWPLFFVCGSRIQHFITTAQFLILS